MVENKTLGYDEIQYIVYDNLRFQDSRKKNQMSIM